MQRRAASFEAMICFLANGGASVDRRLWTMVGRVGGEGERRFMIELDFVEVVKATIIKFVESRVASM